MRATGIVRKIEDLGRIVLPVELRKGMNINHKDYIEIFVEADTIILKKYEPACIFCDNASDVKRYKGRKICSACMEELKS